MFNLVSNRYFLKNYQQLFNVETCGFFFLCSDNIINQINNNFKNKNIFKFRITHTLLLLILNNNIHSSFWSGLTYFLGFSNFQNFYINFNVIKNQLSKLQNYKNLLLKINQYIISIQFFNIFEKIMNKYTNMNFFYIMYLYTLYFIFFRILLNFVILIYQIFYLKFYEFFNKIYLKT
jgi:hypothetical protein